MPTIHPTAIVDPAACLGGDVHVGPYCIVEAGAVIGDRTRLLSSAFVAGCSVIGCDCELHHGAAVGGAPQMRIMDGPGGSVRIGAHTVLREFVTVHRATKADRCTTVGDRGFLMATSHVAHDCQVGDDVTIANGTALAGFVTVGDRAFISGNVCVHQFARIGRLAMIGGLARVTKDVPPFVTVVETGLVVGLNVVGMRRAGMTSAERLEVKRAYQALYRSGLNVSQARAALRAQPSSPLTSEILAFVEGSRRGLCAAASRGGRRRSGANAGAHEDSEAAPDSRI
jgi:UDP-N-acetylglucosamine acyltransferase